MKGFTNGLLFGALLGGLAALFLTSKQGEETREALKEKINRAKEELERKKKELEEMESRLQEKFDNI